MEDGAREGVAFHRLAFRCRQHAAAEAAALAPGVHRQQADAGLVAVWFQVDAGEDGVRRHADQNQGVGAGDEIGRPFRADALPGDEVGFVGPADGMPGPVGLVDQAGDGRGFFRAGGADAFLGGKGFHGRIFVRSRAGRPACPAFCFLFLSSAPPPAALPLITYCTNIHPGESWAQVFASLERHIPAVKAAFSPDAAFPIGLRLAERAARELNAEENRRFSAWLAEQDCFVPTLNGFPYGSFHGQRVKENVYLPDWRSPLRADYTRRLADLLAGWLPQGTPGSISSVPLGFKGVVDWDDLPAFRQQLEAVLRHLARLHETTGREILLALEPEPCCLLETTEEACRLFEQIRLPEELRPYLGLCYDCCHQAVEFEDPAASWRRLQDAGIRVAKVQVSSALKVAAARRESLRRFDEPVYLHQVVVRHGDGRLERHAELGEALARVAPGEEWRCHFHVPIFLPDLPEYGTTRDFLETLLPLLPQDLLLEVETYTWDVLPPELRDVPVTESILRELDWLRQQRHA